MTLLEVLLTVVIGAIVSSIAVPTLARLRDSHAVRSARQEIVVAVEAARTSAVQRGRTARFIVRGNAVLAEVDTAPPGQATVGVHRVLGPNPLDEAYGVALSLAVPTDSVVTYDARGFASPRLGHIVRVRIVARAVRDSVCLTSFGQLLPAGCAP